MVEERRVGRDGQQQRQQLAHPVADRDRAVGPAHPHVHVGAPGVVALGDPAEFMPEPTVVRGIDDPLVEVAGPGVGSHRPQRQTHRADQLEQAARGAGAGLRSPRRSSRARPERISISEAISSPAADSASSVVGLAGGIDLLKAVLELQRSRIEDRELLLEPDREVGRGLESLANEVEVERQRIRRGRSRARRAGRRRGWRCGPSPPAAPEAAARSS